MRKLFSPRNIVWVLIVVAMNYACIRLELPWWVIIPAVVVATLVSEGIFNFIERHKVSRTAQKAIEEQNSFPEE